MKTKLRTVEQEELAGLKAARAKRDAALAELDDPMARLIAAAKAWHDNHWLSFGECSHSVCIELRDAIDYAEQRRTQG